jgi:Nitrite/Sulfite reductase ferredoxin-like half domain
MQDYYLIRVNLKGGLTTPEELSTILNIAKKNNVETVRFGLRQQLIIHVKHALSRRFQEEMTKANLDFDLELETHPNIVSSYAAEDVFQNGNWLTEAIFKEIFAAFTFRPKLKINISDDDQSFSPFFSGHLNFVSSDVENQWHFAARIPKSNSVQSFDGLIHSQDLAPLCEQLESFLLQDETPAIEAVWDFVKNNFKTISAINPLPLPSFRLPYYEGFNRYGNKTWLGVYRRDEAFSINFLLDICRLCSKVNIAEICITPWKSIIIKEIAESNRNDFSTLLAKHNINVRHAANELNWQIEDDSPEALQLKHELVKAFDKIDLRTFGICFGIKTKPKTEVFASIMVRRRYFNLFGMLPLYYVYDISYTKDFDPNGRTKIYFAEGIRKNNLSEELLRSVQLYNQQDAENRIEKVKNL